MLRAATCRRAFVLGSVASFWVFFWLGAIRSAALDDTTPPVLSALSLTPTGVDVSGGASVITVTATITDDLVGVAAGNQCAAYGFSSSPVQIRFRSPSGGQFTDGIAVPVGADVYSFPVTVAQHAEQGPWTLDHILLVDCLGNMQSRYATDLAGDGYPTTFEVTSVGDIAAPVLSALSLTPAAVDVSGGASTIAVSATITDNLAGVRAGDQCATFGISYSPVQIRFRSPSGGQFRVGIAVPVSADVYSFPVTVPQHAEQGMWTVEQILLVDCLGNMQRRYASDLAGDGYPTTFEVTSVGDTAAPVLSALSLTPGAVDVSSSHSSTTVTATIIDDLTGVRAGDQCEVHDDSPSPVQLRFRSPSGGQFSDGMAVPLGSDLYSFSVTVSQYAEQGTWTVAYVTLVDCVGNTLTLEAADLAEDGYPTSFRVLPAPPTFVVDPLTWAVSAGGGTLSVGVNAASPYASWTATSDAGWLTASPSTGMGSGNVTLTATEQTSTAPRSATVTIAGEAVTVTEVGAFTSVTLTTSPGVDIPSGGGTFQVQWTASGGTGNATIISDSSWLTLECGTVGNPDTVLTNGCTTANGPGQYGRNVVASANPGTEARTGTVTVTGLDGGNSATVTVTQAAAAHATRIVDDDGQGTIASCDDPQATYSTVGAAIAAATNGDTVLVCPGTYIENVNFGGKAIAVRSVAGPTVTILDGNLADSVVTFDSGEGASSSLEGFTVRNGRASFDGGGIRVESASPVIRGNVVMRNRACSAAGISIEFGSPLVEENTIAENFQAGCTGGTGGGGIEIGGPSTAVIRRNIIRDNSGVWAGGGIHLWSADSPTIELNVIVGNSAERGGGIALHNESNATIRGNLIAQNHAAEGGGLFWIVSDSVRGILLVNNTIAGNDSLDGSGIFASGFDGDAALANNIIAAAPGQTAVFCDDFWNGLRPVFQSNNVFSATGAAYGGLCGAETGVNGNLSVDPLFIDAAAGDYHLTPGSPAIDAGQGDILGVPPFDLDGHERILDGDSDGVGRVDIGADEAATGPPAALPGGFEKISPVEGSIEQPLTLELHWEASEGATGYEYCYDTSDNGACDGTWMPAWNQTVVTVTGLLGGTTYFWHVRANNAAGTTYADGDSSAYSPLTTTIPPITRIIQLSGDMAFGTVPLWSSTTRPLTIRNVGNASLTVRDIICPTGFEAAWTGTIAPGELQTVFVTFFPRSPGLHVGTIEVAADHTGGTNVIDVSGTAITRVMGLTGDLAFGNVVIGTTATRTLTISNTGTGELTVAGIHHPTGFSGEWSGTIQPGASRDVTIAFTPTAITSYGGTVWVSSDATDGTHTHAASGAGILAQPVVTAHPSSVTAMAGIVATFQAGATGAAPMTVQWQRSLDGAATWSDIPGATGNTYALQARMSDSGSYFRAVFGNAFGSANTNAALLTARGRPLDFDGNGTAERAVYRPSTGEWWVSGQAPVQWGAAGDIPVAGDYDGDGLADRAVYRPSNGFWYVHNQATVQWGLPGDIPVPGDYDGDGVTDRAVWRSSTGQWWIRNQAPVPWGVAGDIPVPGDYDGDLITELAVYRPSTGQWWVQGQTPAQWGEPGDVPVPGDYDGDLATDVAVFRPSTGVWYVRNGATVQWGLPGDIPVPGDYDGNGTTDVAVYRPSTGQWFVQGVAGAVTWGLPGDLPVPNPMLVGDVNGDGTTDVGGYLGDFDGNGTTDVTVFRPSTSVWYVRNRNPVQWGLPGDIPVPGDYNGDGVADRAVWRPGTGVWYVLNIATVQWGLPGDVPVPGDYNGDGTTEVAVYRPSTGQWWVRGQNPIGWGIPGDVPVPGDYDGNGTTDLAVYRPATGQWFVRNQFVAVWGIPGDVAVPGDYNGDGATEVAVYRPSGGVWFVPGRAAVQWGVPGDLAVPGDFNGDGVTDFAVFRPASGLWYVRNQFTVQWGLPGDLPASQGYGWR
jgi:parallel beta-helix repeat protein